jgi:hypothetical protein
MIAMGIRTKVHSIYRTKDWLNNCFIISQFDDLATPLRGALARLVAATACADQGLRSFRMTLAYARRNHDQPSRRTSNKPKCFARTKPNDRSVGSGRQQTTINWRNKKLKFIYTEWTVSHLPLM